MEGTLPRHMARSGIRKLDAVVAKLLGPKGCPWDREQTHKSLIPYLKEEAAELIDAMKGLPPERYAHCCTGTH